MPSNSLLYFITKIINFEGFKAANYHFITENELLIELKNKATIATCPHCQKTTDKVHQSHRYRVRDIPVSSFDVFLLVNRRQYCHIKLDRDLNASINLENYLDIAVGLTASRSVEEVLPTVSNEADSKHQSSLSSFG